MNPLTDLFKRLNLESFLHNCQSAGINTIDELKEEFKNKTSKWEELTEEMKRREINLLIEELEKAWHFCKRRHDLCYKLEEI